MLYFYNNYTFPVHMLRYLNLEEDGRSKYFVFYLNFYNHLCWTVQREFSSFQWYLKTPRVASAGVLICSEYQKK